MNKLELFLSKEEIEIIDNCFQKHFGVIFKYNENGCTLWRKQNKARPVCFRGHNTHEILYVAPEIHDEFAQFGLSEIQISNYLVDRFSDKKQLFFEHVLCSPI